MRQADLAADIGVWLWRQMKDAGADGYVVGLSGGIDSALAAKLAVMGVGKEKVWPVWMPVRGDDSSGVANKIVKDWLGMDCPTIRMGTPYTNLLDLFTRYGYDRVAGGNLAARLRMCCLYYIANSRNALVLGTGNRSELELGYFTKYGDGGVDVLPLGNLLKYEVRDLARKLEVPQEIIDKSPSAGLWEGQTDKDEIGLSYTEIDGILTDEYRWQAEPKNIIRVEQMRLSSQHKRKMPPIYRRG